MSLCSWNVVVLCETLRFSQRLWYPKMSFCSLKCVDVFSKVTVFSEMSCCVLWNVRIRAMTLCFGIFSYQALWNVVCCQMSSCFSKFGLICVFSKMLLGFCCVRAVLGSFSFSTPGLVGWRMSYAVCRLWIHLEADLWYRPIWIKLTWT